MQLLVSNSRPVPLRREKGSSVTVQNSSGAAVYYSASPESMMNVLPGDVPENGTVLNSGDEITWSNFPGEMWFRAQVEVAITVFP